jgi:hypothetical protein
MVAVPLLNIITDFVTFWLWVMLKLEGFVIILKELVVVVALDDRVDDEELDDDVVEFKTQAVSMHIYPELHEELAQVPLTVHVFSSLP